jgi:hypothetical protein
MARVRAVFVAAAFFVVLLASGLAVVAPSGESTAMQPMMLAGQTCPSGRAAENPLGVRAQDIIFGGSLRHPLTRVLLVPPTHGDLGDPVDGPGLPEYLDVTLQGIRQWETAIAAFTTEYPQYGYLRQVKVEVEIFDEQVPPTTAGYDVVVVYVETGGPVFRGLAAQTPVNTQQIVDGLGLGDVVRLGNRFILLSLFSSAPRAGQSIPDYPELNDLESVMMHEFAHTWGIGHTTTWTSQYGPDLMNSPYAYVYGDGDPLGDGGYCTPLMCISTLNLVALAHVYRWLPGGTWQPSGGAVQLPPGMPYSLYCRDGTYNVGG